MKPVNINAFDVISKAAEATIPFGVFAKRSADGKVKPVAVGDNEDVEGLVDMDLVEKDEDGFYSLYDLVPIITKGRGRAWIVSDVDSSENLVSGDFLEIAALGDNGATRYHGLLQEAGNKAGETRTVSTVARLTEDLTQGTDLFKHPSVAVSENASTITFTTDDYNSLSLAVGDYILLQDENGALQINRVKSLATPVVTLQIAASVALVAADDYVHKLQQAEVLLE